MCRLIKICPLLKRKLLHWPRDLQFLRCHLLSCTVNMKTPIVQKVRCIVDACQSDFTHDYDSYIHKGSIGAEVARLCFRATDSWSVLVCSIMLCLSPCRPSDAASGPQYACPLGVAGALICSLSSAESAHTHEEDKEKHVSRWASEKQLIIELKEKCGIAHVDLPLCSHADVATDKEL